jgi:predicted phosphate transport protein (TIGR00153 family)
MAILFKSTKTLQMSVDEYLDTVSQGLLVFKAGVESYLKEKSENFEDQIKNIDQLESKADRLRRTIENSLYSHSLIPEHRGDVLALLETLDNIIDTAKETLNQFDVEHPYIPEKYDEQYMELAKNGSEAADHVIRASRAFFKDVRQVSDHNHKVYFYEKESDRIADRIKRAVFNDDELDLAQKMHLRYFALHIDNIADEAEHVADRLSIYTIKRSI